MISRINSPSPGQSQLILHFGHKALRLSYFARWRGKSSEQKQRCATNMEVCAVSGLQMGDMAGATKYCKQKVNPHFSPQNLVFCAWHKCNLPTTLPKLIIGLLHDVSLCSGSFIHSKKYPTRAISCSSAGPLPTGKKKLATTLEQQG